MVLFYGTLNPKSYTYTKCPLAKWHMTHLHIWLGFWIEWNIIMQLNEQIKKNSLIIASLSKLTIVCNIRCELIRSFSRNLKFSNFFFSKNKNLWKKTGNIITFFRLLYFKMCNLQNNIVSPHYNVDLAMVLQYTRFQATITRNYQDFNFKISLIRTPIWLQC